MSKITVLSKHPTLLSALSALAIIAAPIATSQDYDLEKAERAKSYFGQCVDVAEGASTDQYAGAIVVCKSAMNDIAGLFSAYPEHTPMDLNVLTIYSAATAYVVVATDMQLNENRLSADGCNHAFHVEKMYERLTAGTNEKVKDQLRRNAQTVKEVLIPWCMQSYGQGN